MERIKKLFLRLLFPKTWLIFPLIIISAALLVYVFTSGLTDSVIAYLAYVISAYTLTVTACRVPKIVSSLKKALYGNPHSKRYMTEAELRARISLYSGLCIHILYAVFKLASGIYYHSFWFGTEAVYYIILSIIQFLLVKNEREKTENSLKEWQGYRICGCLMLLLNLAITVIIMLTVYRNQGYVYSEIIIYATAAHTFYRIIIAIIQIGKFRKRSNPILSASKFLNLSASLTSLFALQTAMLTQFGNSEINQRSLNMATGGFVCFSVIYIAISMIIRSTKAIKEINNSQT